MKINEVFYLYENKVSADLEQGAIATISPIEIVADNTFENSRLYIDQDFNFMGNGLVKRVIKLVNYDIKDIKIKIKLSYELLFEVVNSTIPCILYNENDYGNGSSPKGFELDGKPWVFSYDRVSVPSCTISQNKDIVFAAFASDRDKASLHSSCSIEKTAKKTIHKLIYPVCEEPVSYTNKNVYSKAYEEYITLVSGASFEAESYIFFDTPIYENYGYINLLNRVIDVFNNKHLPQMNVNMVDEVCTYYLTKAIKESIADKKIQLFSRDYTHPIGNNIKEERWKDITLEDIENNPSLNEMMVERSSSTMGFASQGFMHIRMILREALRTKDENLKASALNFIKEWISNQKENGLISVSFPDMRETGDITEYGWGVSESVKLYKYLKNNGEKDADLFLDFSKRLSDFFVRNFDSEDLFGQLWNTCGECISVGGCGGSFLIKGLLELYEACSDEKYFMCAKKALDKYLNTYINKFTCSAGAIDCKSVDKESSFPFLYSCLKVYEHTHDEYYLECAKKSAAYFLSWMFVYDVKTDDDSEFSILGYYTSGGTAVSAEHQCIDPYASVIVGDLIKLYKVTNEDLWQKAAKMIWINSIQCLTGINGSVMHEMERLPGMQNECFAQTRWTKYRSDPNKRGHLNDFIGSWLDCFKLYAIEDLGENINLLEI